MPQQERTAAIMWTGFLFFGIQIIALYLPTSDAFVVLPPSTPPFARRATSSARLFQSQSPPGSLTVRLETDLDDEKVTQLFAWISRAYAGDPEYNNLMLAMAAIFGDLPPESEPKEMVQKAAKGLPSNITEREEMLVGEPFSLDEREQASLGAMGAAQWTGRWRTRPHALLEVTNMTSVDEWMKALPRGCKRSLKRALALEENGEFTVVSRPIHGGQPAPHSSLAAFRCVVQHEVRLLANTDDPRYMVNDFLDALGEAVGRYMGTTRMAGEIREYRNSTTGQVIAIAHEVTKGDTVRGQWFYATDLAARNYVWFHSVYSLVERAIATPGINVVDLGPSGSDAFSQLKEKYGFRSVVDWPAVANYEGPFWYFDPKTGQHKPDEGSRLSRLLEQLQKRNRGMLD